MGSQDQRRRGPDRHDHCPSRVSDKEEPQSRLHKPDAAARLVFAKQKPAAFPSGMLLFGLGPEHLAFKEG